MSADTCIFDIHLICATCLSRDRKLFTVKNLPEFVKFYSKLSLTQTDKVCWECHHTMRRTVSFINRAQKAQAWLQDMINNKNCDIPCLSTLSISQPSYLSSTDVELTSSGATVPDPFFVPLKEDIEDRNATSSNNITEFKDKFEVEILVNERLKVEVPSHNDHTTNPIHNTELHINSMNNMGVHIDTMHMHNDIPPVNIMHNTGQPYNTVNMNNFRPPLNKPHNIRLPDNTLHMHNMRSDINTMNHIVGPNKVLHKDNIGSNFDTVHSNGLQNTRWPNNIMHMHNIGPHINTKHIYNGVPPINSMNMNNEVPHVSAMNNIGPPINTPHNIRLPDNTMDMHNMRPHVNTMNYIGLPDNAMHMHNIRPHMHNIGQHMNTMHNAGLPYNMRHMHNIGPPINVMHNTGPINTMHNVGPDMNIMNNTEPHINTMHIEGLSNNAVHNIEIPINTMQSTELPTSEIRKIRLPYTKSKKNKVTSTKKDKIEDIKNTPAADPPDYIYTEETLTEEGMLKWRETKRSMDCVTQRPPEFRCDSCIEPLQTRMLIKVHARKHTELHGDYECDICTQRFFKEDCLETHRKLHYRVLKCRYCEFVWDDANGMREHCSDQHDVKQTVWHCEPCQQEFPCRKGLTKHLRNKHRRIRCEECGLQLNEISLNTHMLVKHRGGMPVHKCEECGKQCRGLDGLRSHMKIHSTKMDPDAHCAECDIRFRDMARLRQHMLSSVKHGGKSYFRCDKCGARFKNTKFLEKHKLKYHSGDMFTCDICNQTFKTAGGRRTHRKTKHEGKVLPKNKICDYCGMAFTSKHLLATHINTHTGARPFVCKLCGADFGHQSALYLHGRLKHKTRDKHGQLLQRKKSKPKAKSKKVNEKDDSEEMINKKVKSKRIQRGSGKDKSEKLGEKDNDKVHGE